MARRVRVRGSKAQVFRGTRQKSMSGFTKDMLMKNKNGKIVTKKQHAAGKRAFKNIRGWTAAVSKARKALGHRGTSMCKSVRQPGFEPGSHGWEPYMITPTPQAPNE